MFPLKSSNNCYNKFPVYVGAAPSGEFIPSALRLEAVAVWVAVSTMSVLAWQPPTTPVVGTALLAWLIGFSGLLAISQIECGDDRYGIGFWLAHLTLAMGPACVKL